MSFIWKGWIYKMYNNVFKMYKGVDGIKIGYIWVFGFNIIMFVKCDGYYLIVIVMGGWMKYFCDDYVKFIFNN